MQLPATVDIYIPNVIEYIPNVVDFSWDLERSHTLPAKTQIRVCFVARFLDESV